MDTKDILTILLAVYGAVLSTVLALREWGKERRSIKIVLEYISFEERFQVKIINIGHRPITITKIAMDVAIEVNGKLDHWEGVPVNNLFAYLDPDVSFPITIRDGEQIALFLFEVVTDILRDNDAKTKIYVYDAEGNEYNDFEIKLFNAKMGRYEPTPKSWK